MVFCTEDVATGLRDAFTYCYRCKGKNVTLSDHEDNDEKGIGDFDYDHEVVVFQIRSQAMEKLRKKPRACMKSFTYQSPKEWDIEKEEGYEFCSVGSCFSDCCMSDLKEIRKGSVIQELCHCQGWPFGLGRKAMLLPPLPKSPAESWSWRKPARVAPIPYI